MEKSSFQPKVHFIAGKGGVGKTLISEALARFFADNFKTLLVELSEEDTKEADFSFPDIKKLSTNLFHIKIFPNQAIYEYLCLKFHSKKVVDSFLAQRLIRALSAAMPGLSDLTRLGKIWFHADETNAKGEIYEKIVVDLPSSGFVKRFLSIASIVYEAVKVGPLAKEAKLINEYFLDRKNAVLHLVVLLEELVVNETVELYNEINNAKGVNLGLLFINRLLSLDLNEFPHLLEDSNSYPQIDKVLSLFRARANEERLERNRLIREGVNLPCVSISDQVGEIDRLKIIKEIMRELTREE